MKLSQTTNSRHAKLSEFDPKSAKLLSELGARVQLTPIASQVWEEVLTPQERDRLGGDVFAAYKQYGGTPYFFAHVRGISPGRAVAEIAAITGLTAPHRALWLARELRRVEGPMEGDGQLEESMDERVQQALLSKDFVLVYGSSTRSVYWLGERVDVDWMRFRTGWEFLRVLAEQGMNGDRVDFSMLGLSNEKTIVHRKANLKRSGLPEEILNYIRPDGPGAYRLNLLKNQIAIIDLGSDDWGIEPLKN